MRGNLTPSAATTGSPSRYYRQSNTPIFLNRDHSTANGIALFILELRVTMFTSRNSHSFSLNRAVILPENRRATMKEAIPRDGLIADPYAIDVGASPVVSSASAIAVWLVQLGEQC